MHQKWNGGYDHATRFFDDITSFFSMLHSFLIAFRKTAQYTIFQLITNTRESYFQKEKESLKSYFRKRKTL